MNEYEFGKAFWTITLLNALPEKIKLIYRFVELLIQLFKNSNQPLPIYRILDFL